MRLRTIILLSVTVGACVEQSEDQLFPPTHSGNGTLSFLKNGTVWLTRGSITNRNLPSPTAGGEIINNHKDTSFLVIEGMGGVNGVINESVKFIFPILPLKIAAYRTIDTPIINWPSGVIDPSVLPKRDSIVFIGFNSNNFRNGKGIINISTFDSSIQGHFIIVSGTFNFTIFDESSNDSIRITDGRFDIKCGFN